MGEGLAAACFSSFSPSLSSSPFSPPTAPSQYQPCSSSLPVVSASLPALPSCSQLSSSEQGSRQGWEGRTVTRHSCWLLAAALRVAPSDQQQSGSGMGSRMAGWRALVSPWEVSVYSLRGHLSGTENKWEKKNAWVVDAIEGLEDLWLCTITFIVFWWH